MIQLKSNLEETIARVTRLRDVRIPAAMAAALHPRVWREAAVETARHVLTDIPKNPGEEKYVEPFVRQVYAALIGDGLVIGMKSPRELLSTLAAQLTLPGQPSPFAELALGDENAERDFEQLMLDWVEQEKKWDEEVDGPKDEVNIRAKAQFISYALQRPDGGGMVVKNGKNAGRLVRDVFLPHVLDYIGGVNRERTDAVALDPATAAIWLRAVLAAWSELVRGSFVNQVKLELKKT